MHTEQLAKRIVAHRLRNHGLSQFQPWRVVADEVGIKNTSLSRMRKTEEFFEAAKSRTKARIDAFESAVGQPPKYQMVYRFISQAFGFDRECIRSIIDECMRNA